MTQSARDALKGLFKASETHLTDSASFRLAANSLAVHVKGLGNVSLPITETTAARLISLAKPAHFGYGENTLHDVSVRDTWEITPDQVTLGGDTWEQDLTRALDALGPQLGLPGRTGLELELHSMLIYGEGQFFTAHQDSEKHDDMIATLVISLPSDHSGGELVVDDRGAQKHYRASSSTLELVAFYSDRRHEVLPVRSGHRVTLTFNILARSTPDTASADLIGTVTELLARHFSTEVTSPYGLDRGRPQLLAVLLDHEYSQHGLQTGRLKGVDAQRMVVLDAAATDAGYDYALAAAEITETWDVIPFGDSYGYDFYDDGDGEDTYDVGDDGELNDLIDESLMLTWWTDPEAPGVIELPLGEHEVCAVMPTVLTQPYDSQFEGYMGNYGNTVDRWYRRTAIILWPRTEAFRIRAKANPVWAFQTIQTSLAKGKVKQAREQAAAFIAEHYAPGVGDLPAALDIAVSIHERHTALALLKPFTVETLTPEHTEALSKLDHEYHPSLVQQLFDTWRERQCANTTDRRRWIETTLAPLSTQLRQAAANAAAEQLVSWMHEWLLATAQASVTHPHETKRYADLTALGSAASKVLSSASEQYANQIIADLNALGDSVLPLLIATLRAQPRPAAPGAMAIADIARARLTALLKRPKRAPNDWSIAWRSPGGDDLDRLAKFLNAPDEQTWEWPLATPRRKQIHEVIDRVGLPVEHTTRRKGRPYTLVLRKTSTIFRRDTELRFRAQHDLDWLIGTFG